MKIDNKSIELEFIIIIQITYTSRKLIRLEASTIEFIKDFEIFIILGKLQNSLPKSLNL